jgi:signal transduction histidine kinase
VSEKDFRLPVALTEMSRELAPVHARLNQTLDQLREAFAREKQAVADISHELRTPIASLLATIDVSLRKPRTPEQYRNTLEDCRAIAKQLGQLVERIMTLASLDAGTAHTSVQQTDAAELVMGCAAVIRPLAEAHGLTLQVDVEEGLELTTDRDKLREVLMNLLHNAVEYNQPGGRFDFNARRDGDSVVFEIRDTGIGVPADLREKIFERFFRADASRHATGVHAGLGLAIVKEYVQRLNGTITLQSETNVGSTFTVRLPAAVPADGSTPPPQPDPEQSEVSAPSAKGSNFKRRTYGEVTSSRS